MDTIDTNEAPKRRIEDHTPDATLDWTKPGAPAIPVAAVAAARVPLRAVASMCVKNGEISVFPTPAAKDLAPGHYMLSASAVERAQSPVTGTAAPAAPAVPHQYRKLTSELTLKELAAEFFAVSALGGEAVISAGVCQKLFEAMTTAPAVPVIDAPRVENRIVITLRQAHELVKFFGGHDAEVTVAAPLPAWGEMAPGLYAYCTDYPEEGSDYLGPTEVDDDLSSLGERGRKARAALAALPIARQAQPTDLSKRLRAKASQPFGPEDFALLTQAAEEIERYYGGMMAWKRTAEKKDRDWSEARMARENDRAAARAQPTDRDAVLDLALAAIEAERIAAVGEGTLCYNEGISDALKVVHALKSGGSTTEGAAS
mgnify:CR=1 FL=1